VKVLRRVRWYVVVRVLTKETFLVVVQEQYVIINVNDCLFFDGVHPTEKANYQFAKLMWSGSAHIVKLYNLKTLLKKI
jgi:hypothetical protein